jgi:NadR type nicotinamide-nucleotide adenylyltransferase
MSKKIIRVAVTGPESTGKTWLAKKLAEHFNTVWVPEFAREYLKKNGNNYNYNDILNISKGQKKLELQLLHKANGYIFSDTDPLVTKIWSEIVFGKCDLWIINEIKENPYDLYLLCYPDLLWEEDPLRENPNDRDKLFEIYKNEMENNNLNFNIVKGFGENRLKNAVNFVINKKV